MRNKTIQEFYRAVKLNEVIEVDDSDPPVTHVRVFHKSYPRFPSINLPDVEVGGELDECLLKRYSERDFSGEPLTLRDMAYILKSCRVTDPERVPERRTYPSAGARFPVETYAISFNIESLGKGAYHYNISDETLEILWEKNLDEYEKEIVSPFLANTAAAIIFTSVLARSDVKYGAKAYPFSLIEAGHMGQNIQMACASRDIGCCPIGGFVNDRITQILDLTEDEIPVYVMGLGKKRDAHEDAQA